MSNICGIYCITHIESGFKYIGQSVNVKKRLQIHSRGSSKSWIGKAVIKHGWAAFKAEIVEICEQDHLNEKEIQWIASFGSFAPNGYNLTSGGNQQYSFSAETRAKLSFNALNMSDETRAKIGAKSKDRKFSPESIAQRVAKQIGSKRSEETKRKQSVASTGKIFSEEHRANLSLAAKTRMQSQEIRDHLSKVNLGKKPTQETRDKMSAARTGHAATPETRAKMSAALLGRVFSDDHKAKLSAAAKLRNPEYLAMMVNAARQPEAIAKRLASRAANKLLSNNTTIPTTGNLFA